MPRLRKDWALAQREKTLMMSRTSKPQIKIYMRMMNRVQMSHRTAMTFWMTPTIISLELN